MLALAVDRRTAEVAGALKAAGIPSILLKGPSIARWLYPGGGRGYGDTDLLVAPAAFAPAEAVLRRLGFEHLMDGWAPAEHPPHGESRTYVRSRGPDRGIVDLHASLHQLPDGGEGVWEALWARTRPLTVAGVEVAVLDEPALALHVVLHAVQHAQGLHTGEDLRRALGAVSAATWGEVAELAAELGLSAELAVGLCLEPEGAEVARRLGLGAAGVEESQWWPRFAPRGAGTLAGLAGLPTWRARARWARWAVLPSPAKLRYATSGPGRRPRSLAVGYLRWWWGLARSAGPALAHVAGRLRRGAGVTRRG